MAAKYKLAFGVSSDEYGFRNSKQSGNRFSDPSITTRELIQNALDANKTGKVEVSFDLEEIHLKDLPGMPEYKEAFDKAEKYARREKRLGEKDVISSIERRLKDRNINVLWVVDNGEGLGDENMRTILADGGSKKTGKAGSFGVGHLATFSSSDLSYVIYGGCPRGKEPILSGQCILASYDKGEDFASPNGYLCLAGSSLHPKKRQFPKLQDLEEGVWKNKLDQIKGKGKGTGSFVCITAFNNFEIEDAKRTDTEQEILYAAASHFMPAIFEGGMIVRVGETVLDKDKLHGILMDRRGSKNKKSPLVASGSSFYNLFLCMQKKQTEFEVPALHGEKVRVRMDLSPEDGRRSIHLYRHGMWITDKIPEFWPGEFSSYKPFTAIILVDKEKSEKTGTLIGKTEGESHMQMHMEALKDDPEGKKKLTKLLKDVKAEIKRRAIKKGIGSEYIDFVSFGPETVKIKPRPPHPVPSPRSIIVPEPDPPPDPPIPPPPPPVPPVPPRPVEPKAIPLPIRFTTPIVEGDSIRFSALSSKRYSNVEMRAYVEAGSDTTCTKPLPDRVITLMPNSEVNGIMIDAREHVSDASEQKDYVAVKLKSIKKGESAVILKMTAPPPPPSGPSALCDQML